MNTLPNWAVVHVAHDSSVVPGEVSDQFVLSDAELACELLKMTDHHTHALFAADVPPEKVVRAAVSRLVVDVERFELDDAEPMATRGMGVVYTATSDGRPFAVA